MKITTKIIIPSVLVLLQLNSPIALAERNQNYGALSPQEKQSACQTAFAGSGQNMSLICGGDGATRGFGSPSPAPAGVAVNPRHTELLLVEPRFSKKGIRGNPNDVEVYAYDYSTDTLKHTVINLQSGRILDTEDLQGVQLPLTQREIDRSKAIAGNDIELRTYLEKEYLLITGQTLQSLDQLKVKAFVFLADSMPDRVNLNSKSCGIQRCARLVMHTSDHFALETAPIINLSTGSVTQRRFSQ